MGARSALATGSITAYLVGGTALTVLALQDDSAGRSWLHLAVALALLFAAAYAVGWWGVALPVVTLVPIAEWSRSRCEPDYFSFCEQLTWPAAAIVAGVFGLPVALVGAWLGSRRWKKQRSSSSGFSTADRDA